MTRRRIAVTHPRLSRGGSEATALWTLTALRVDHDVTLVTTVRPDWERLDRTYGTRLAHSPPAVLVPPLPRVALDRANAVAIRHAVFQRFCRSVAQRFDVLISAYNIVDFGVPAIHLLADFTWDRRLAERYDPAPAAQQNRLYPLYRWVAATIAGPSKRPMLRPGSADRVLANSEWTAAQMASLFGLTTPVIYPPVDLGDDACSPAKVTRDPLRVVALGRVAPEKRLGEIMAVVGAVRGRTGHDLQLSIVGGVGNDSYGRSLQREAAAAGSWVTLEGQQTGDDKLDQLARATFGLHGRVGEPFGIAVAEMVNAGVLPLVPRDSGAAEIVGNEALLWSSHDEAVDKLSQLVATPQKQAPLRARLQGQCGHYSLSAFTDAIREHVREFAGGC